MNDYLSFLICDRGTGADLYVNGLPIGRFVLGEFKHEQKVMPDGSLKPFALHQLPEPRPINAKILKARLLKIIESIPDDL